MSGDFIPSEYTIPCPKCGKPVKCKVYISSDSANDVQEKQFPCKCEFCGEEFDLTVACNPRNVCCNTGVFSFFVKGSKYPAVHHIAKDIMLGDPIAAGGEALKFLKERGVGELEYYCSKCHETHKEYIEDIPEEDDYGDVDIECHRNAGCRSRVSVDIFKTEYALYDYVVKTSTVFGNRGPRGVCGVVVCTNDIEDTKEHTSVKKMNFM